MQLLLQYEVQGARYCGRVIRQVIARACQEVACPKNRSAALIVVGDKRMRALNAKYRGQDQTTNVLAFSGNVELGTRNVTNDDPRSTIHAPRDLGDIFIALPEAKREAKKYGWTLRYALARLALHGFLHLAGYDHAQNQEARRMEKIENIILQSLSLRVAARRLGNPYKMINGKRSLRLRQPTEASR